MIIIVCMITLQSRDVRCCYYNKNNNSNRGSNNNENNSIMIWYDYNCDNGTPVFGIATCFKIRKIGYAICTQPPKAQYSINNTVLIIITIMILRRPIAGRACWVCRIFLHSHSWWPHIHSYSDQLRSHMIPHPLSWDLSSDPTAPLPPHPPLPPPIPTHAWGPL